MGMIVASYPSSLDARLRLSAEFHVPDAPKPLCLFFHGWHMTAAQSRNAGYIAELARRFFVVNVDMRGRGASSGSPDASGFELVDGLDAAHHAAATWPAAMVSGPQGLPPLYVAGGSGGGANTLALAGKAPDVFVAALAWAAVSDYALWYEGDHSEKGVYRDEMEAWIGGTPAANPAGYRSRGGLHVIENLLTRLYVIHATEDRAVPVEHARRYGERCEALGKGTASVHLYPGDHGSNDWVRFIEEFADQRAPVSLEQSGQLLVHSFVACRPFWLVLDHPSRMGVASYTLDAHGGIRRIRYATRPGSDVSTGVLLRVFRPEAQLELIADGPSRVLHPTCVHAGSCDFRWTAGPAWEAQVR